MFLPIPFAHNFSFMFTKGKDLFRWIFKIFSPPLAWSQIHSFFNRSFNFFLENLKMCQFCWRFLQKKLTVTAVHVNNACLTQLENLSNTNLWRMIDRVENFVVWQTFLPPRVGDELRQIKIQVCTRNFVKEFLKSLKLEILN